MVHLAAAAVAALGEEDDEDETRRHAHLRWLLLSVLATFQQWQWAGHGLELLAEPEPTSFLPDFGHGEVPGATGINVYPNPKGVSLADITEDHQADLGTTRT
jgi:hypothetical protein